MSKSKEALTAWLEGLEKLGKLSEEQLTALKSTLSPDTLPTEVVDYVGGSVLRQEDYSRLAAQMKAKEREVADFQTALTEWKGDAESQYLAMQQAKARAEAEVARLTQLAKSYEIPEAELGKVVTVESPKEEPTKPNVDVSEFMKKQEAQDAMVSAIKVQNKLLSLAAKHQQYFGKPLDDEELVDRAIQNQRTIEAEWEETYKVADKRQEIATAQQEAHDQKIREEERARLLSELKLPETRPGAPTSPISGMFKQNVDAAADHQTGVQAALEAYGVGKYRPNSGS
jgi:hypothetical protein